MVQYKKLAHSPTLNTIIMVENTLKSIDKAVSIAELKRYLPRQINHYMLKLILAYLEESSKITVTLEGIRWTHVPNPNLKGN